MNRSLAAAALAAALLAAPATAQRRGSVEAGLFARGTLFDPSLETTAALGVGARVSVHIASNWLVEADVSTAKVDGLASRAHVTYQPVHLRVAFLEPYSDRGTMLLGLGLVATHFGGDLGESDNGLTALLGMRVALFGPLVGRLDGTLDFVPSPANRAGNNWNGGLQVGAGYQFGR